jgi:hypothetical protein
MDIEREDVVEAAAATVPVLVLVGVLMVIGTAFVTTPDYGVTVSVTDDGSPASNATLSVTDGDYAGAGEYPARANATWTLPAPSEAVNVSITATVDDRSVTRDGVALVADGGDGSFSVGEQSGDGNLSVEVGQDSSSQLSRTGGQAMVAALVLFVVLMTIVGIRLGGDD